VSEPSSVKDVAAGCRAEHEQVNRHPEHQQERPENRKAKLKNGRGWFCPPILLPWGQSRGKAADQGGGWSSGRVWGWQMSTYERAQGRWVAWHTYKSPC